MDGTVTMGFTDTLTEGAVVGKVSMDGTVAVASTDTLTEGGSQGVHSWMVHGWHSNCGIH